MKKNDIELSIVLLSGLEKFFTEFPKVNPGLNAKTWYSLTKNYNQVKSIMDDIRATNDKLIEKYGISNESGQKSIQQDSPKFDKWQKEYNDLLGAVETITPHKIDFETWYSTGVITGVPNIYDFITYFVTEPKDESAPKKEKKIELNEAEA